MGLFSFTMRSADIWVNNQRAKTAAIDFYPILNTSIKKGLILFLVEMIAAVQNVGFCIGFPAGLFQERFGATWTFLLATILGTIAYVLLWSSTVLVKLFNEYYGLLHACFFLQGRFSFTAKTFQHDLPMYTRNVLSPSPASSLAAIRKKRESFLLHLHLHHLPPPTRNRQFCLETHITIIYSSKINCHIYCHRESTK